MQLRDQTFSEVQCDLCFLWNKSNFLCKCRGQSNLGRKELLLGSCMMLLSFALVHVHVSVILGLVRFLLTYALFGAFE